MTLQGGQKVKRRAETMHSSISSSSESVYYDAVESQQELAPRNSAVITAFLVELI